MATVSSRGLPSVLPSALAAFLTTSWVTFFAIVLVLKQYFLIDMA
jgi:hypothetical protein